MPVDFRKHDYRIIDQTRQRERQSAQYHTVDCPAAQRKRHNVVTPKQTERRLATVARMLAEKHEIITDVKNRPRAPFAQQGRYSQSLRSAKLLVIEQHVRD
jgi:hypothetical protein